MPRKPITKYDPNAGAPESSFPKQILYYNSFYIPGTDDADFGGRIPRGDTPLEVLETYAADPRSPRRWGGWVAKVFDPITRDTLFIPYDFFLRDSNWQEIEDSFMAAAVYEATHEDDDDDEFREEEED